MAVVASRTSPGLKSEAIYENQHYARGIDGVASSFINYNSFNKTKAGVFFFLSDLFTNHNALAQYINQRIHVRLHYYAIDVLKYLVNH